MTQKIKLADIRLDGNTQPRKEIDDQLIQHYTEILLEGRDKFPPVDLWFDGKSNWLSDGFHRYHAHKRAGFKDIEANVNNGTKRDAFRASLKANSTHGKPRTPEERRHVVTLALEDFELGEMTDAQIAIECVVSAMTVGRIRKALGLMKATRTTKKGHKIKITNIGSVAAPPPEYTKEDKLHEMAIEHTALSEENTKLKDLLAVRTLPTSEQAKTEVQETIESLRAEVKDLEFKLRTMTQSRNEFQSKNAEMIKQMNYWKKRAEKAEKATT